MRPFLALVVIVSLLPACSDSSDAPVASLPEVARTEIPDSSYWVHLFGPDREGNYSYSLFSVHDDHAEVHANRSLGAATVDASAEPKLSKTGDGVYEIRWSDADDAAFVTVDAQQGRIVTDSTGANGTSFPGGNATDNS